MKLTPFSIKNAKPGRHGDGKGLYLLVSPSGSKSWVLRVQVDGKRRDFGLGSLDTVSLAKARDKAAEARSMAKDGIDPSVEWKRAREGRVTFETAARQYYESVKSGWRNRKHAAQWINTLEAYAFPAIGNFTVDKIAAADIQAVLVPIWRTIPETARRVRQRIGSVLDFAHSQGWRQTEAPMRAVNVLMRAIKQPKRGNFAAMPYHDVPVFMRELRTAGRSTGRLALQFLILTAARSGEVRGATWGEIDWEKAQWNIPGSRMKMGEPHSVPLTTSAVEVLREAEAASRKETKKVIFPGLKGQPLSDMTLGKVLKSAGAGGFTVHGFRSSFRDWVAECTVFPGEWAEAALAHSVTNRVEGAYRRTKFLVQRRKLMGEWDNYLMKKIDQS